MKKTLPYIGAVKRGVLIVAVAAAASTELLALAPSHRRAATGVHRPDSARLESYCHRGRGLDVCLW